jgi:ribosomal 30S subunit maturation factor RimM
MTKKGTKWPEKQCKLWNWLTLKVNIEVNKIASPLITLTNVQIRTTNVQTRWQIPFVHNTDIITLETQRAEDNSKQDFTIKIETCNVCGIADYKLGQLAQLYQNTDIVVLTEIQRYMNKQRKSKQWVKQIRNTFI